MPTERTTGERPALTRFARHAALVYSVAVATNYVWEMAQMPFYVGMRFDDATTWLRCFLAALADGGFAMSIWLAGALVFRSWLWINAPRRAPGRWTLALGLGLAAAFGIELWALARHRWAYSPIMPLLPGLAVGVVPLLQMALLPPVSMLIARRLLRA
jgi:hypothetical protein